MASKVPIRTVFDGSDATGLAEYQTGEFVPLAHGGIGASLTIGSAGQVLKVNSGASALEFGGVEAVINIDGMTDGSAATLATTDKIPFSDGGTEKYMTVATLNTFLLSNTQTLSNKTLTAPTITGTAVMATLDISGDVDVDGTLETDALTIAGVTLAETIADTVGAMVGSNTETNITVTYEDSDNTLDFVIGTLNQDTTGLAGTATALATARTIGGTSFDGTANIAVALAATSTALASARTIHGVSFDGTANIDLTEVVQDTVGAMFASNTETGITVSYEDGDGTIDLVVGTLNQDTTGLAGTATALATARTIHGVSFDGTANIDLSEVISDTVGAMFSSNTETNITATYQDADNTIDLVIGTLNQDTTGLAGTATALATARTIGGTSFDGTANIAVALAATATALASARTIGGVSFDGTANINLPGVNASGTQDTSGTAATATLATTVTVSDSTANTNFPVVFNNESNALLDDTGALRYNPSTGTLLVPNLVVAGVTTQVDTVTMEATNAVIFEGATADDHETTLTIIDPTADRTISLPNATGTVALTSSDITGNSATATALATARTIGGTSFDGTANIAVALAATATALASARTIHGVSFDGTANIDLTEVVQDTVGAMFSSNTETGVAVSYEDGDGTIDLVVGTLNQDTSGTAAIATTVTITDNESTDEDNAIIFGAGGDVDGGNLGLESDGTLTYNPSTGKVTATGFVGTLTGNVTGNTSGTAATVTTAAQPAITSLGTLTTLTVDNVIINGTTIGHTSDTDLLTLTSGVLTVAGSAHVGASYNNAAGATFGISNSGAEQLEFVLGSNDVRMQVYDRTAGAYDNLDIDFNTLDLRVGTTAALSINSSRNVGIGTASPGEALEVYRNASTTHARIKINNPHADAYSSELSLVTNSRSWLVGAGDNAIGIDNAGDFHIYDATATAYRMVIKSDGKIGIATTVPATNLHIAGGAAAIARIDASSAADANPELQLTAVGRQFNAGTGGATFATTALRGSYYIYDATATAYRFTINSGGYAGIGTTAPGAPLEVFTGNTTVGIRINRFGSGVYYSDIIQADSPERLAFKVGDGSAIAERMAITGGGNVCIGTTDNLLFNAVGGSTKLAVVGDSASTSVTGNTDSSISIINKDGTASNTAGLHFARADTDETPNYAGASIVAQFGETQATGQYPSAGLNFLTSSTQNAAPTVKMTVNNIGEVGIGIAPVSTVKLYVDTGANAHAGVFRVDTAGYASVIFDNQAGSGTRNFASFRIDNSAVGSITSTGSATAYNTFSDYRLKENVDYTWDATTRLKQLKPCRFNWIADDTNTLFDGFLAHEASVAVPEAVVGDKDAVDSDNNPEYQGIDQSKLVPLLVKTIQELEARITALEG